MGDHYVYAIYNRTTGEYYLGKRSCRGSWADDGKYMGSGQKLRRKMKKHPDHVWEKEVLLLLDSAQEALEYERVLVGDRWVSDKTRCLNLCPGGDGGVASMPKSEEHCAKISAAKKGRKRPPLSDEHRAKIGAAQKGKTYSEETKAKMSAAHKGKTHSDETKAKLSAANKGKTLTAEARAKLSAALRGKPLSDETRAKMSAAQKGRKRPPLSDEQRAKLSAALSGMMRSDETRAKISAGKVRQTVDLVRAGVHYIVQVEDVEVELRAGAEFKPKMVWLHHPQAEAMTFLRHTTAKALLLLDAGWQWGCRSALRRVGAGDIDLTTGLLR